MGFFHWVFFFFYLPLDKTIIMWKLTRDETNYGIPQRALRGHSHFVSDVVISSDGQFALSGSWDGTLRLWDLTTQVAALGHRGEAGYKAGRYHQVSQGSDWVLNGNRKAEYLEKIFVVVWPLSPLLLIR